MCSYPHIAIVGASARAAARAVVQSGRTAVTADLFADADLQQICSATRIESYPDDLVDWLQHTECDGWLYTGALENHPDVVDRMAAIRPLLGNPGSVLRRVRDPLVLQEVLQAHGLRFPETRTANETPKPTGDWLVKSYQSSSGLGVSLESHRSAAYRQRYVRGIPGSAAYTSGVLLGVSQQLVGETWTGANRFQYCGSLAPWTLPAEAQSQLQNLGQVLRDEFGLEGLFGVDFVFDGYDIWVVEVNPRYTASMEVVQRTIAVDMIDCHVDGSSKQTHVPKLTASSAMHGKAIWYAAEDLQISQDFISWAMGQNDLADIPAVGGQIGKGHPVMTVCTASSTRHNIIAQLKQRFEELQDRIRLGTVRCN